MPIEKRLLALVGTMAIALGCNVDVQRAPGVVEQGLAPEPPRVLGDDAGDAAWVEQVVPILLGRPVRSFGELKFLAVAAANWGRPLVAESLMNDPAFVDRWTGVLLDRLRVDRVGVRSQSACFSAPMLSSDAQRMDAARVVLYTRRAGQDATIAPSEPSPPASPGSYNMADVVRGSLLIDNVFPVYRGFVFAMVNKRAGDPVETAAQKSRQIGDHFMQSYMNKSMTCLGCHRTFNDCSGLYFTPGDTWAQGQEGRVFGGLSGWATSGGSAVASDGAWTSSFSQSTGTTAPFTGWSTSACGGFGADGSASVPGTQLMPATGASVWTLDDRLKEGYLALNAAYASSTMLVDGSGFANEGRTLGAYWLAATFANDVWREVFGSSLTVPNYLSKTDEARDTLWNLAERHVVGRGWSLKGLLLQLVTSNYFNRLPSGSRVIPHVYEPYLDPAFDKVFVGDAVHRRSADLLLRMKASALGWTDATGRPKVTHFPTSTSYPSLDDARGLGLYLQPLEPSSTAVSQTSLLAWEGSAGKCSRPAGVTRDWIDALDEYGRGNPVPVGAVAEALKYRLTGRGIVDDEEKIRIRPVLDRDLLTLYSTAYTTTTGPAALRALCGAIVRSPQFLLEGVRHGIGYATTDFDLEPTLSLGDMQGDGTLAGDSPEQACESWRSRFASRVPTMDCSDIEFPPTINWRLVCPGRRCLWRDDLYNGPRPFPCLTCANDLRLATSRPPPFDVRDDPSTPIPMRPARSMTFLAWAENGTLSAIGGTVRIVRKSGQFATAAVGSKLALGDSLELWPGATFKFVAPDGQVFESPQGGMPAIASGGTYLFMTTGQSAIPAPPTFKPTQLDASVAQGWVDAAALAAKNGEPGAVAFEHTVTAPVSNSSYIDHPSLNAKPDRVVLVTAIAGAVINNRAVGVWYDSGSSRWAIYNESGAAMPSGARFDVRVLAPSATAYVHRGTTANTSGHMTWIDDPRFNGRPSLAVQVTHVWNPPGASGVYNNHPVGVWYDSVRKQWAIYNDDFAAMPASVSYAVKTGGSIKVTSSVATRIGPAVVIDDPNTNGAPSARLFLTHNWNPPGGSGVYHAKQSALRYDTAIGKWTIVNLDGTAVADGVAFNVHRGY